MLPPTTLILDFDGTVCLGDDPVRAYAAAAASYLSPGAVAPFTADVDAFLAGGSGDDFVDGYAAVHAYAAGRIGPGALAEAYMLSRQRLADGELDVHTPPGLDEFLQKVSAHTRCVLATNAPPLGITETLATLGISDLFDTVVTDAAKPSGLDHLLDSVLGDREPHTVLSVGDIWINDLDLPHRRGCATAFIDRWGYDDGRATFVAPRFEDLYDSILRWSTTPDQFTSVMTSRKGTP